MVGIMIKKEECSLEERFWKKFKGYAQKKDKKFSKCLKGLSPETTKNYSKIMNFLEEFQREIAKDIVVFINSELSQARKEERERIKDKVIKYHLTCPYSENDIGRQIAWGKEGWEVKVLRRYRVTADFLYSEVTDGVHTQEEYEKALKSLEDSCVTEIAQARKEERQELLERLPIDEWEKNYDD